jgi:hypothetical protein
MNNNINNNVNNNSIEIHTMWIDKFEKHHECNPDNINCHNGQRKLFVCELEFLTDIAKNFDENNSKKKKIKNPLSYLQF